MAKIQPTRTQRQCYFCMDLTSKACILVHTLSQLLSSHGAVYFYKLKHTQSPVSVLRTSQNVERLLEVQEVVLVL